MALVLLPLPGKVVCNIHGAPRYILESDLLIFGKDVEENMRLLVTFADKA